MVVKRLLSILLACLVSVAVADEIVRESRYRLVDPDGVLISEHNEVHVAIREALAWSRAHDGATVQIEGNSYRVQADPVEPAPPESDPAPTQPVIDSVTVSETGDFTVTWFQPGLAPDGSWEVFINGIDTGTDYRASETMVTIPGTDSRLNPPGTENCFIVIARYTQFDPTEFLYSTEGCATSSGVEEPPEPTEPPASEALTVYPEFQSVAVEFDADATHTPTFEYRLSGSSTWKPAHKLTYDPHEVQWRGVVVWLQEDTSYDVRVTYGVEQHVGSFKTWAPVNTWTVGQTTTIDAATVVTQSGTAGSSMESHSWHVVDGQGATVNGGSVCVEIDADYVILRNITCSGQDGSDGGVIAVSEGRHHVVIERNTLTDWSDGGFTNSDLAGNAIYLRTNNDDYNGPTTHHHIIVQRNHIYDPAAGVTSQDGSKGPRCISWRENQGVGRHVIRFNSGEADSAGLFGDCIGGGRNRSIDGFPGDNSAIYGNYIAWAVDDCMELEGGNKNLRVWHNYGRQCGNFIGTASIWQGPAFVFRNFDGPIRGINQTSGNGGHIKVGGQQDCLNCGYADVEWKGRTYLYHNTFNWIENPDNEVGKPNSCNHWSTNPRAQTMKNNLCETSHIAIEEGTDSGGCYAGDQANEYDYNFVQKNTDYQCGAQGANDVEWGGSQDYITWSNRTEPLDHGQDAYFLPDASEEVVDAGVVIPNITLPYTGAAPDIGGHEQGGAALCFGHDC